MGGLVGQLPDDSNRVTLDRSRTDAYGNPVPDVRWSLDARTKRTIERATEIQRAILTDLGAEIGSVVTPATTGPAFHHMGTTRMGSDPTESVVDERLRTHDVVNLSLPGSGAFVTSGALNPTLTIAALSLKCADAVEKSL